MRTFSVFGVCQVGRVVAGEEILAASPDEARRLAEAVISDAAILEVWEGTVLIARINNPRSSD